MIAGLICVNFCLVFLNESVLKVEGSNGRSSRQRFAEMRIDRRPRSRLTKTTNLTFKILSKKNALKDMDKDNNKQMVRPLFCDQNKNELNCLKVVLTLFGRVRMERNDLH